MPNLNPRDWPIVEFLVPRRRVPQLESDEAVVAHALVAGNGVAILTDRRLVIANGQGERSVALTAMGAVEVGFGRPGGEIARGLFLLGIAFLVFALAGWLSGFITGQAGSIDSLLRSDTGEAGAAAGISSAVNRGLGFAAAGVRWLPWLALCFLAWGGIRLARGLRGATTVNVVTAMGEYRLWRFGRSDELDLLGRALARRFTTPHRAFLAETQPALPGPQPG